MVWCILSITHFVSLICTSEKKVTSVNKSCFICKIKMASVNSHYKQNYFLLFILWFILHSIADQMLFDEFLFNTIAIHSKLHAVKENSFHFGLCYKRIARWSSANKAWPQKLKHLHVWWIRKKVLLWVKRLTTPGFT